MKNFGKTISLFLIVFLLLPTITLAANNTQYADTLYELGLFKGTDNGYELDKDIDDKMYSSSTRDGADIDLIKLYLKF